MEQNVQKFLEAEETAEKLVQTLKQLHTEATSYHTATEELDTVRQQLLSLIESTEKVVNGSHEVVGILKEIGGPEILNRLTKIENRSSEEFAEQSKRLRKLKTLIIVTLTSSITAIIIGIIALLR
jgi:hypothetical protein